VTDGRKSRRGKSRRRQPTIADVARVANVSVSTVSRVVRDHADVGSDTREKVLEVIEQLSYRPSPIARALVRGWSQTVALLMSDIANPFYPELAKHVEQEAGKHGYSVVICNTDDDPRESKRIVQRLLNQGIEGFIHASVGSDESGVLSVLGGTNSIVFTNRRPRSTDCNYVVSDNRKAAVLLTTHLLDRGYRRIGFIAGPEYATNATERLEGFQATMDEHPDTSALVVEGDFGPESGAQAVGSWLRLRTRPTAIIGINDSVALGAIGRLLAAGYSVPGDVAVAGFDDIALASSPIVGLTTVAQHIEGLAQRSVRLLLRRLEHGSGGKPIHDVLEPTLIVRRTTTPPNRDRPTKAGAVGDVPRRRESARR
jgi:LacI family transcriptional regulator, galactose operon repressor